MRRAFVVTIGILTVGSMVLYLILQLVPNNFPDLWKTASGVIAVLLTFAGTLAALSDVMGFIERVLRNARTPNQRAPLEISDKLVAHKKHNREIVLKKVHYNWIDGVFRRSIHDALLITLGLGKRHDLIDHPWSMIVKTSDKEFEVLPEGTHVLSLFDESGGSLLILGEPGSGKTMALLELTRDLLMRAEKDEQYPIPVVLNLSSWSKQQKDIPEWIVDELNEKYQVPLEVGSIWVSEETLLLLLDGLDEVREDLREKCVETLNKFRKNSMMQFVVVCRLEDYAVLRGRLQLSGAVQLQSLSPQQIDEYLASLGHRASALRSTVKTDTVLGELAKSPLMLSIMSFAYADRSESDFEKGTIEQHRSNLFATYVNRMFEHRVIREKYTELNLKRHMTWLSKYMIKNSESVFNIENLQPSTLSKSQSQRSYRCLIVASVSLLPGVFFGLACGLAVGTVSNSILYGIATAISYGFTVSFALTALLLMQLSNTARLCIGLAFGCAVGITILAFTNSLLGGVAAGLIIAIASIAGFRRIGGVSISNSTDERLMSINTSRKRLGWSSTRGAIGFVKRLPFGFVFGVLAGLTAGLRFGWQFGLIVCVLFAITIGIVGAGSYGMTDENVPPLARPNEGTWRSAENALRYGLVLAGWCSFVMFVLSVQLMDVTATLAVAALFFVATYFIASLVSGGYAVLQHVVLRILLRGEGQVPIRYPDVLRRGEYHIFLRRVGNGFIFVHRLLLEHFAAAS